MNYIGKRVRHANWGEGTIVGGDANLIEVRFPNRTALARFKAPDCFASFLELLDAETAAAARQEAAASARRRRGEEEARAHSAALRLMESRSESGKAPRLPRYASCEDFFAEQERALTAEIAQLRSHGGKRVRIFNGERIERRRGVFVYAFESESELNYPDGTQITLWRGDDQLPATLLGCEELAVYLACEEDFGERLASIEFSAEPWRLLSFLIERLRSLRASPTPIARALMLDGPEKVRFGETIVRGQDAACEMARRQPITFLWGPPGTGKTHTLARIALEQIGRGKRVLMLSYSNVSVDGAALRVFEMDENQCPGRIVRCGYPRDRRLIEHPYLSSYNLVIGRHPELLAERDGLLARMRTLPRADRRALEIRTRLKQIRAALAEEERRAIGEAAFVATTVSKAIADATLYEGAFDAVLFDEASMAYIPQLVFAAGLARERFICIGDFAQLPPIVQSGSESPLNLDIFRYCRIAGAVEQGCGHEWLCMLDVQRRMRPEIAEFASRRMYHGLLRSDPEMASRREAIVRSGPFAGRALALADLSGAMSVCTKTSDESRINLLSALVSIGLAASAARGHEVGVITPYHAQSRLLHALARDLAEACPELHPITCATVHQFQGSERDVVIYDAVDCYRMRYPGVLLTSAQNDSANRLFNVALSRARGKFAVVANADYLASKGLSPRLMFRQLIDELRAGGGAWTGDALWGEATGELCRWFSPEDGEAAFLADLEGAAWEIRIDIPAPCALDDEGAERLARALAGAKERGAKVVLRASERAGLPQALQRYAVVNGFVADPVAIIDGSVCWFGQPASAANFQSEGTTIPTRFRPIIRFAGRRFAGALFGFLSMDRTMDAGDAAGDDGAEGFANFSAYASSQLKCPRCGRPLRLRKGKRAFLGCSGYPDCRHTALVEPEMVEDYFYFRNRDGKRCPRDGTSLVAEVGRYGLFIHCCGIERHSFRLEDV